MTFQWYSRPYHGALVRSRLHWRLGQIPQPLHWVADSDDLDAAAMLIDGGGYRQ